ncbi:MAG: iron-sulfur cluster assembly scaffold protein [Candidatus Pacearchaeota archaeon]
MTLDYSKEVMKNYMNPKNLGEIKNADGIGKVGNPTCGDIMWLYIKVKKEKGKEIISDIKFKTFGCAAAIATSSMVTQLAKGKTLKDAEKIKYDEVMKSLGGLPRVKVHCSMMAQEALKLAIKDYEKNKK